MTASKIVKKMIIFSIIGGVLISTLVQFTDCSSTHDKFDKNTKLMDYGVDVYDCLLGGAGGSAENQLKKDCLRECPSILEQLRFDEDIDKSGLETLDHFMKQYYKYGYLPREPYDDVPGGEYVTAMDAPLLGVCCQLAYERTGDKKYKKYVKDLIPYICSDTSSGGFVLKEDRQHWWPLEYAWRKVTPKTAWYVSNGSLYGTLCIELLWKVTNDKSLRELLDKTLNAYEEHADEFYYKDDSWTWYSLNSVSNQPTINRNEKLFIEIRALKALYKLSNINFYKEEYDHRIKIWKKNYPVYKVSDSNKTYVSFLRAGAPHPYQIDIYPTTIKLYDKNNNYVTSVKANDRTVKNATIFKQIPANVEKYRLYARVNDIMDTLIAKGRMKSYTYSDENKGNVVSYDNKSVLIDGDSVKYNNNVLCINADHSDLPKAIVQFKLQEKYKKSNESYWCVDLTNQSDNDMGIQVVLFDSFGKNTSRYLQAVKPGHNILLFSRLGFEEGYKLSDVTQVRIDFITNALKDKDGLVKINNIYHFSNTVDVVKYVDPLEKEFDDFWFE